MDKDVLLWSLNRYKEKIGRCRVVLHNYENVEKFGRSVVYRLVREARVVRHKKHHTGDLMWACWEGQIILDGKEIKVYGYAIVPKDKVEWIDSVPRQWYDESL